MKRTRRSPLQRLGYVALYACLDCKQEEAVPRFTYRFGNECRCPRCGTSKLTKLSERDNIDRMETGFWNLAARLFGGKLYHCCFCRLQFYDRRPLHEFDAKEAARVAAQRPRAAHHTPVPQHNPAKSA